MEPLLEGEQVPLSNQNMLLRGYRLLNTEWCFGLVIFAGELLGPKERRAGVVPCWPSESGEETGVGPGAEPLIQPVSLPPDVL